MKSWLSRTCIGLTASTAAIAIPLIATPAFAAPPPGEGWQVAGGDRYASKAACEAEELPAAQSLGYHEVWCDDSSPIMTVYYR